MVEPRAHARPRARGRATARLDRLVLLRLSAARRLLMFGPVLWLVLSSFKSAAALNEFPPQLLPYGQKSVAVPGHDRAACRCIASSCPTARRASSPSSVASASRRRWSIPAQPERGIQGQHPRSRAGARVRISRRRTTRRSSASSPSARILVEQRVHHGRRDADHAAVQRDGRVCAVEVPVRRPRCRVPAHHFDADDPADDHSGAELPRRLRARLAEQPLGRDLARGRDADRRVPAAPVHADDSRRADRCGADGQRERMAHLLADRPAAVRAGACRARDLLGDVALERLPVAADRAVADREVHAAARAERVPGRAHDAVALSAGDDGASRCCRSRWSSRSCSATSRPASPPPASSRRAPHGLVSHSSTSSSVRRDHGDPRRRPRRRGRRVRRLRRAVGLRQVDAAAA